jgi:hypothetical protein
MGDNKAVEINQYPLLLWHHRQLDEYPSRGARLMVIVYSFNDYHINEVIIKAADKAPIFIIEPHGVDAINKQDPRHLQHETELMAGLNPCIIEASRRPLIGTFANNRVEHSVLMRFFAS